MSETSTLIGYSGRTIGREELTLVPTPPATETHRPVPHLEMVEALVETLSFRHIGVVTDEYAVIARRHEEFGVLDLETGMAGCRFSIGIRNCHDRSMRLDALGHRVFVCSNMAFAGDFTPYSPNTRSRSRSSTASQSAWIACSGTSSPCASRWKPGKEVS